MKVINIVFRELGEDDDGKKIIQFTCFNEEKINSSLTTKFEQTLANDIEKRVVSMWEDMKKKYK